MTAPKRRPSSRQTLAKTPEERGWELGPVPDDIFGSAEDLPEPKSRRAPHLSIPARLRAVAGNPDIYRAAAAVFITPEGPTPGRPRKFPAYIYLIYDCAITLFGTATAAESNLAAPEFWAIVQDGVRAVLGDQEANALLRRGPTRGNWSYFFARHLKPNLAVLREQSRELWLQQALGSGLLEMDQGTWIRPACGQTIHGDATVAHPASSQTEPTSPDRAGRMKNRRVDPDATYTTEGGGTVVYGNKYLSLAVRAANQPHSRVVLDLQALRFKRESEDPDKELEGDAVVASMLRIRKSIAGRLAFTYDKALHGVHRAPLIAAGITVYTPQVENLQPQPLQTVTHEHCCHELYAAAGRVCERLVPADSSRIIFNPLPALGFHPRPGSKRFRFYHQIGIPCRHGPHTVMIRVDETSQDRQIMSNGRKRFNRTHHLRMVYSGTPAGARLAGFRQDSESKHSTWDLSYRHKHVPAYGSDGGLALYFGYAWLANSIARAYAGNV